jgi:hypothetical protein
MCLINYLILIKSKLIESVFWIKKLIVVKSAGQTHAFTLFITEYLGNNTLCLSNTRIIYSTVLAHSSLIESLRMLWINIFSRILLLLLLVFRDRATTDSFAS